MGITRVVLLIIPLRLFVTWSSLCIARHRADGNYQASKLTWAIRLSGFTAVVAQGLLTQSIHAWMS